MNRVIAWFVRNPVAANLLMGALVVGGLTTLPAITMKTFPDLDVALINVVVEYRGAAPEDHRRLQQRELLAEIHDERGRCPCRVRL